MLDHIEARTISTLERVMWLDVCCILCIPSGVVLVRYYGSNSATCFFFFLNYVFFINPKKRRQQFLKLYIYIGDSNNPMRESLFTNQYSGITEGF